MEASLQKTISWSATLRSMPVNSHFTAHFRQESYLRHLASKLKKEGFGFTVCRARTGVSVTCHSRPQAQPNV